jgi:transcriptional regulator with XRE-family HTH domain
MYNKTMTRAGMPSEKNWYLREWMDVLGKSQTDMCRMCDWSKSTASQLYNNKQDYSPRIVMAAAAALEVEPFELLMKPERAMALRRQLEAAMILAREQ